MVSYPLCGAIAAWVDGVPMGQVPTRPAHMRQQFFQFDTRAHAGEERLLEIDVAGGSLLCFDLWLE
ncbi:hypothetical protein WMF27_33560 [Sorangium sp. So ce281]|uniref:hypothetical protein n=1 Tax=unclassified Sorangium TaxID=2621164 RepID=UPI003F5E537E